MSASRTTILQDRVKGVLIGICVGDQNLGPHQMALRIVESILEKDRFDKLDIFNRYMSWFHGREVGWDDVGFVGFKIFSRAKQEMNDLYSCPSTFHELIENQVLDLDKTLNGMTAGVNPAHRNTVLSMFPDLNIEQLLESAVHETRLTHASEMAAEVSMITNFICRKLITREYSDEITDGHFLLQMLTDEQLMACIKSDHTTQVLREFTKLLASQDPNFEYYKKISTGGFSPETLKTALYFVFKYTSDIRKPLSQLSIEEAQQIVSACMGESFQFAGKDNFSPVLVGPILGALFGSEAFANCSLKHCTTLERINKVLTHNMDLACDQLAVRWNRSQGEQ